MSFKYLDDMKKKRIREIKQEALKGESKDMIGAVVELAEIANDLMLAVTELSAMLAEMKGAE